jgi:hypothetical protein
MSQPLAHSIIRYQARQKLLLREREAALTRLAGAQTESDRAAFEEKLLTIERNLVSLGPDPSAKMG